MSDASKIRREIPLLGEYGKDIDSWIEDFSRVMDVYNIQEPRMIFIWLKEAVEADVRNLIKSLCVMKNNVTHYPNYKEVQAAIEDYLEVKPRDKCSILKALKIKDYETIKSFNYKYRTLYHRLTRIYQQIITVDDYLNSIKERLYVHSQVILEECESLNEAYKVAERAEKAEKQTLGISGNQQTMLMYQNQRSQNLLLTHPLYQGLTGNPNNINRQEQQYGNGVSNFNTGRYQRVGKVLCYNCQQIGHKAFECPYSNKRNRNNNNFQDNIHAGNFIRNENKNHSGKNFNKGNNYNGMNNYNNNGMNNYNNNGMNNYNNNGMNNYNNNGMNNYNNNGMNNYNNNGMNNYHSNGMDNYNYNGMNNCNNNGINNYNINGINKSNDNNNYNNNNGSSNYNNNNGISNYNNRNNGNNNYNNGNNGNNGNNSNNNYYNGNNGSNGNNNGYNGNNNYSNGNNGINNYNNGNNGINNYNNGNNGVNNYNNGNKGNNGNNNYSNGNNGINNYNNGNNNYYNGNKNNHLN